MVKKYFPKRGDIIFIDLDPIKGHEQAGRRPALVLSNTEYNKRTGFIIACPITTADKNYSFDVSCVIKNKQAVILSDQVRSLNFIFRKVSFYGTCEPYVFDKVLKNVLSIVSSK